MRSKTRRRIAALAASAVLCVAGIGAGAGAASAAPPTPKDCRVVIDNRENIALVHNPPEPAERAPVIFCVQY